MRQAAANCWIAGCVLRRKLHDRSKQPANAAFIRSQIIGDSVYEGNPDQHQVDWRIESINSSLGDVQRANTCLNMTQAQTQLQAALQWEAQLPRTTLFDFLG